jgi:hypothetical protein
MGSPQPNNPIETVQLRDVEIDTVPFARGLRTGRCRGFPQVLKSLREGESDFPQLFSSSAVPSAAIRVYQTISCSERLGRICRRGFPK